MTRVALRSRDMRFGLVSTPPAAPLPCSSPPVTSPARHVSPCLPTTTTTTTRGLPAQVLSQVRGKDFRHEKTKKKRGSYRGGAIETSAVCSYKFESDDE